MRKSLIVFLCLIISFALVGQDAPSRHKEIGLFTTGLNSFGFSYKTGNENALWRFNTLFASGDHVKMNYSSSAFISKQNDLHTKFNIGREYHVAVDKKLDLIYGLDLSFGYRSISGVSEDTSSINSIHKIVRHTYSPGINIVLGLRYKLNQKLFIGAEVLPSFTYNYNIHKTTETINEMLVQEDFNDAHGISYGLGNGSVRISIAYKL